MSYVPKLNDYVKWNKEKHSVEGWIYFVGNEYCTIEISVRDKPDNLVNFHKKTHCCVVCYPQYWNELEYVKSRSSEDLYKSQLYR